MESFAQHGAADPAQACDLTAGADLADALAGLGHRVDLLYADRDLGASLDGASYDGCLLALHGTMGGSGAVQTALAQRRLPWVGPSAPAVSLAFDKAATRQVLAYQNLPVPTWVELTPDAPVDHAKLALLGWPCVLKPRRGAHGAGVTVLDGPAAVRRAVDGALCLDEHLLIERRHAGVEIQVALLDGQPLGAAEVERGIHTICPPRIARSRTDGLERMAARAARVLGLTRGVARVDFIVDPQGNEVLLEVEPLPSLHRAAVVSRIAVAAGLSHAQLLTALVERLPEPTRGRPRYDLLHAHH